LLAAAVQASPIADESRAEIGGAATLTAEHQARLIAVAARQPARDRGDAGEDFDARELIEAESATTGMLEKLAPEGTPSLFPAREGSVSPTLAQSPAPLSTFTANRSDGSYAADTSIAVSFTHVVVTNRNQIGYYSKAGRALGLIPVESFFAGLKLATLFGTTPQYYDTHALYDAYRNRFWIGGLVLKDVNKIRKASKFVVAVSRTSNPFDGWYLYWWDAIPGDGHPGLLGYKDDDQADYPLWGIDSYGVYQSNYFCHAGTPRDCAHQQITFFPAAPLAAGAASLPLGWLYYDLKNPDGSPASGLIQPAHHHGSSGGSTFFVSTQNPRVIVWRLRNHLTPSQVLENVAVPVTPFDFPTVDRAQQKNSSDTIWLTNPGNEALKAVYRDGNLYAVFNDAAPWFTAGTFDASIRLVRLNVTQFPNVSLTVDRYFGGNSAFYDQPNARISYAFPSVEVNKAGDAVVVYGRAGASIYPEVSYSVYPAAGPDILPSRRLRQGEAPVELPDTTLVQLHDFDGASVDPFDDTAVWVAAPYGEAFSYRANDNWAIAVGKVFGTLVADLIVESVSYTANARFFTVTAKIRDQGDRAAAASTAAVYLRPLLGGASIKLGTIPCPALVRDQLVTMTKAFARPAGLAKGKYVLLVAADSTNAVLEYSGANNSANAAAVVVIN
jgi:hypothetical protein